MFVELFRNPMVVSGVLAMWIAQILKVPIWFFVTRKWKWNLIFNPGGMPSSHSSLMSATTVAIGLYHGFDTAAFAVSFALMMIVLYDAAGVRRQAGYHAQKINVLIEELLSGHPISTETLKEVIGHTPQQVLVGAFLGLMVGWFVIAVW